MTSTDGTASGGMSFDGSSSDRTSTDGTASGGMSFDGSSSDRTSTDGTASGGPAPPDSDGLSRLLEEAAVGDSVHLDQVLPILYHELRAIAASYVRQERPGHTLQATALTHEAYLRLRDATGVKWKSRSHLIALAARAMRRALVDHARARRSRKRGGDGAAIRLEAELGAGASHLPVLDLLELDQALEELGRSDARKLDVVEMLYFGGLTTSEAAEVLQISRRTVERDWRFARAWLLQRLRTPRP